jgi:hypothetical protein
MKFFILEDELDAMEERLESEDAYEEKRHAALKYLGDNWVLSPNYQADLHPQHNVRITS